MVQKFYRCSVCGQIIAKVKDTTVPVVCCGKTMTEIIPSTTDASIEKHVPVYTINKNIVSVVVGSVEHPMMPEHYIEWIFLQTNKGNQCKFLSPTDAPTASFYIADNEQVEAVYAYCNLHSLWKSK